MYLLGVFIAFFATLVWESMFYHRNDGGLKSMTKREWLEDILISLTSWLAVFLVGLAFYIAIDHKEVFEKITNRKL